MQKVLLFLAPGFEETEAVTVIDLLRRVHLEVTIAGLEKNVILGSHQIGIESDVFYKDIQPQDYDVLILPGGQPGTNNLAADPFVIDTVRHFNRQQKVIAAICAAPTVLYKSGILKNRRVTSFPFEKEVFKESFYQEKSVVLDGHILTSRGVGTAIPFALALIALLKGEQMKTDTARRIVWDMPVQLDN